MTNSSLSTGSEPESELTEIDRRLIRTIQEQYQRRTKRLNYFHQISQASMETRPPPTTKDNMLKPHHPAARNFLRSAIFSDQQQHLNISNPYHLLSGPIYPHYSQFSIFNQQNKSIIHQAHWTHQPAQNHLLLSNLVRARVLLRLKDHHYPLGGSSGTGRQTNSNHIQLKPSPTSTSFIITAGRMLW
ncbi:hypothetical protein Pst134EB_018063 [Puccinia striiformis f. sp. tritici]|nr:hypothetical protein Pst134EB_018063 [Puccinia striiformis f. sp. tritici]